jgi:hypothetical protein
VSSVRSLDGLEYGDNSSLSVWGSGTRSRSLDVGKINPETPSIPRSELIESHIAKYMEKHSPETRAKWDIEWLVEHGSEKVENWDTKSYLGLSNQEELSSQTKILIESLSTPVKESSEVMNLKWGRWIKQMYHRLDWDEVVSNESWNYEWVEWWVNLTRTAFLRQHLKFDGREGPLLEYIQLETESLLFDVNELQAYLWL